MLLLFVPHRPNGNLVLCQKPLREQIGTMLVQEPSPLLAELNACNQAVTAFREEGFCFTRIPPCPLKAMILFVRS